MAKTKDERIRKFKRKRIWPSILGLFFISTFLTILMALVIGFLINNVMTNKTLEGLSNLEEVAKIMEQADSPEEITEIEDQLLLYIEFDTNVEDIALLDTDQKPIWSGNNQYPSKLLENTVILDKNLKVFIHNNPDNSFTIKNDEIGINKEFFEGLNFKDFINTDSFTDASSIVLGQLKVWLERPSKLGNIYVLQNVTLNFNDIFSVAVCAALVAIIIAIFVLYYLISFISLICNIRKINKIIYTDMITGGPNWIYFEKKGNSILKRNRHGGKNYAVIHLRMRKYRSYCTCFGVKDGEALIEKYYDILKKKIKHNELMAHRENAHFGLFLTYENREQLVNRIKEMEVALDTISPNIKLYFGVGIYLTEKGDKDIEQLYNNALLACDMPEDEAESKIAFFDIEMNNQRIWERKVEDDLDRALANKEFQVYLQPKIQTSKETLAGAEALVRWIHPEDGFIPPNKFIPILEKNGFITKLDDYMLEEVAALQSRWIAEGRKIVPISVNVSRAHFTRTDLAKHICAIVDKYNTPHDVIELELTESAFFDDKNLLLNTVKQLRQAGFSVSMDDFGAGYSSLNSLKELQIDVLKIDADFFRGADEKERGLLIVSEVIDLAKKLDMKIVAEGIESREQVDFLTEQQCDLIQGYFFAKPMPIPEFVEKYKD
ncbi:MAG: EAL domain-containing protein [Lachnospiraceae bacterium]|nr:EAL domain-containing protein [Lachnospiraceae bacterium]